MKQGIDKLDTNHFVEQLRRHDGYKSYTVTSNYTITDSDKIKTLYVDMASGTITLPSAANNLDRIIEIIKISASGGLIAISGNINGVSITNIDTQYTGLRIKSNGSYYLLLDYLPINANQNIIINGNMVIAQRGTSFAAIASSAYSLDRWQYHKTGVMVHTITHETADAPSEIEVTNSMKIDCTTIDAAIAAGDFCFLKYSIEGFDFRQYWDKTFTLKFWVKATKTGIYCVAFGNNANNRSYVVEYTVNSASTWEEKTITITHDSTGTWGEIANIGMYITWALAMGSTYHTTADSWQAGQYFSTSNQVNACDNTANDFLITGVQLNLGPIALPYMARHYKNELALCQRYYIKYAGVANSIASGLVQAPTLGLFAIQLPVEMRVTPTLIVTAVAGFNIVASGGLFVTSGMTLAVAQSSTKVVEISAISAGMTTGAGAQLRTLSVAYHELSLDAEF